MNICNRTVGAFGEFWGYIGWGLFLCLTFLPFLPGDSSVISLLILIMIPLWLAWFIIDGIDQEIPVWMWIVGVPLFILSIGSLIIRTIFWVVYYLKVRA
ncbi:MAG: hypothetical protein ABFD64_13600 [Armatimonadota bacterium]